MAPKKHPSYDISKPKYQDTKNNNSRHQRKPAAAKNQPLENVLSSTPSTRRNPNNNSKPILDNIMTTPIKSANNSRVNDMSPCSSERSHRADSIFGSDEEDYEFSPSGRRYSIIVSYFNLFLTLILFFKFFIFSSSAKKSTSH